MLGMSPCLLNTFDQFLWPSSTRLALPAPGFTPVLSPLPIPTVSLVFNTVEASVWPLDPFTLSLNTSPQLLWLSNPPAHVFVPPEHILLVLNTIEASGQCLFTYLCTDLDPRVNTCAEFCMAPVWVWACTTSQVWPNDNDVHFPPSNDSLAPSLT